jgi:hypothetical protein
MKILYAVQGTGNGHACRAGEFIPLFRKQGRVNVLLSGNCVDVKMGQPVDYHLDGISYTFGKTGGIDIPKTLQKLSLRRFFQDVRDFPIQRYDLVINDFEPVTAWAARRAGYSAGNVAVMPVSGTDYLHSLETCHGCILGAGFEAPAEGLYLGKKMMVIPMRNQYEQKCNAAALKQLGITVENTIGRDFPVRLRN